MILYSIEIDVHHIFMFKALFILHMEFLLCLLKMNLLEKGVSKYCLLAMTSARRIVEALTRD